MDGAEKPPQSPSHKQPAFSDLPDGATFFQCMQMLLENSQTENKSEQARWSKKYQLKYNIKVVEIGAGHEAGLVPSGMDACALGGELPWPCDQTLQVPDEDDTEFTKEAFVTKLQQLGNPDWLHRMGLFGRPKVSRAMHDRPIPQLC